MKMFALIGLILVVCLIALGAWVLWRWAVEADRRMGAMERRSRHDD